MTDRQRQAGKDRHSDRYRQNDRDKDTETGTNRQIDI